MKENTHYSPDLIIHMLGGTVGALGLVSHSYRRAACGSRVERWLSTANTDFSVADVNCKGCLRTKKYKVAVGKVEETFQQSELVIHLAGGSHGAFSSTHIKGACGNHTERWWSTDNTDYTIADVNCRSCLHTRKYREAKAKADPK